MDLSFPSRKGKRTKLVDINQESLEKLIRDTFNFEDYVLKKSWVKLMNLNLRNQLKSIIR